MQKSIFAFHGFAKLDAEAAVQQRQRLDAFKDPKASIQKETAEELQSS